MSAEENYGALRKLADAGREAERRLGAHPYPRPTGPAPTLEQLRDRRDEIERIAARHGARTVRVFGSVARGDSVRGSDVDILVEMNGRSLFEQAALQGELEDLLACPVHVMTAGGLRYARDDTRRRIEHEAVPL